MQQTRAVELGTGLFVFMGILALFFLTTGSRASTATPVTAATS
jgi:hypothetical protein